MVNNPQPEIVALIEQWRLPQAIAGRLLEIHASYLDDIEDYCQRRQNSYFDARLGAVVGLVGQDPLDLQTGSLRKVFDVLAEAMLEAGRQLTEPVLTAEIPRMALDVSRVCRWMPFELEKHPTVNLQTNFFRQSIIRWRARLTLTGLVSPKKRAATTRERRMDRSTWLDRELSKKKGWSDVDLALNGGPTFKTIKRFRSGKASSRDGYVREKLAEAFGCDGSTVPE